MKTIELILSSLLHLVRVFETLYDTSYHPVSLWYVCLYLFSVIIFMVLMNVYWDNKIKKLHYNHVVF